MKRKYEKSNEDSENKKISTVYFKLVEDGLDKNWICKCGTLRVQAKKTGYTNLMSHIRADHKNYQELLKSDGQVKLDEYFFVSDKAAQVYGWIDWIVTDRYERK